MAGRRPSPAVLLPYMNMLRRKARAFAAQVAGREACGQAEDCEDGRNHHVPPHLRHLMLARVCAVILHPRPAARAPVLLSLERNEKPTVTTQLHLGE